MANEHEAYQKVRILVALVYAMTRCQERRAELSDSLRHAALAAATHILDSTAQEDRRRHVASLHQSLLALQEVAQLVEAGRTSGDLPAECAGSLLAVHGSASEALDRAIEECSSVH